MSEDDPWQCLAKDTFKTPALASKVAKKMSRRDRPVHSFRCDRCRLWHVGEGGRVRLDWKTGQRKKDGKRGPRRLSYEEWKRGD